MAAFALVTIENGMQTVIPRSEIISQDSKECFILGKRHQIVINGFNEDFLSLYNFAVSHNTCRLKVVLEKNVNIGSPNNAEWKTPKGRKESERITDSLDGQKKMKPRNIFRNVPIEEEGVEGITRIRQASFISSTVSPILSESNDLPPVFNCNCLSSVCNCFSSASDSLPPMPDSLPPTFDSLPPTIDSLSPPIHSISPTIDSLPPTIDSLPPTIDSLPPTIDSLPPTIDSLPPTTDSLSPTIDSLSPTIDSLPPTIDSMPSTIDSLPFTFDDGLPSMSNGFPSMSDGQPSTSSISLPSASSNSLPSASSNSLPTASFNSRPSTAMGLPFTTTGLPSSSKNLPSTSISHSSISSLSHMSRVHLQTITEESISEIIDHNPPTLANKAAYKRRICNKPNVCKFCRQPKTNIKRHIMSMHRNETEVKEFMALADENEKKIEKLAQIRRDGNFSAFKEGENIVPSRVSKYFVKPDASEYIACTCCQIILKKESLRKHLQKNCTKNSSNSSKGMLYKSRAISENIHKRANEVVRDFLFPAFREGPIKETIRFDNLIILYGNEMACKYRSQHHYAMIRNRMIRMAKVLIMIKEKNTSVCQFEDILKPHMFDSIIEVINRLGNYDQNTGNYNKPSLPTEVGTSLKYMLQLNISECIKNGNMEGKKESKNVLHLLKTALPAHVNKTASESLLKHKRKKIPILPSMDDIHKLNSYLLQNRNHLYETLMKKFHVNTWINLGNFTLMSILIFNRRRPGELERSLISDLDSLARIEENTDTYKKLNESDKNYVKEYVRFVIRGKLARGVPVLLHNSMHECIKLLIKYRKEAGIADKNPYIFALPQCGDSKECVVYRHVSATSLMRKFSEECGATNPKSLRATILRKHVATKSMSLNLDNEEIHLLQGYLGHAEKIHREYYRQPVVERDIISVTKVLLAAQSNSPISGKDWGSGRSTPIPTPMAPVPVLNTTAIASTPQNHNSPTPGPSKIRRRTTSDTLERGSGSEYNPSTDGSIFSDDSDLGSTPKGKRKRLLAVSPGLAAVKRTWNTPERQAGRRILSRHITQGKLPSTNEILKAIGECEDLRKRTVPQIRVWLFNNMKTKKKITWNTPTRHSVKKLFKEFIEGEPSYYPSQEYIKRIINSYEDLRQLTPRRVRSQIQQQKRKYHSSGNDY